jgi:HD domain
MSPSAPSGTTSRTVAGNPSPGDRNDGGGRSNHQPGLRSTLRPAGADRRHHAISDDEPVDTAADGFLPCRGSTATIIDSVRERDPSSWCRMTHRLREASIDVVAGRSLVAPVIIKGLREEIHALGIRWQRKREFHLTAVSADTLERAGGGRPDLWEQVTRVASGRSIGPLNARAEIRRVSHPAKPDLRTLIVMVDAAGLAALHRDLSDALGVELTPPPAHVTLYSTDPGEGIGIGDQAQLAQLAPELSEHDQEDVRRAISFGDVLFDDDGIPFDPSEDMTISLGGTDAVFTPRVMRALAYAAHVHRYQRRTETGIPYLAHLISVAALVAEDGGGEIEVMAALLHDTAEDHGGELRLLDVRRRFGTDVEAMVRRLSDSLPAEGQAKEQWRPRKLRYLAHLRDERNSGVLRVSNADKLHNARAILADHRHAGEDLWRRFSGTREDQLWYYRELASIFVDRRPDSPLARELEETLAQLEREVSCSGANG